MFYNVMRAAMTEGHYVEDVFGDQSGYYKHCAGESRALLRRNLCRRRLHAEGNRASSARISSHVDAQLAYNGVPCWKISVEEKMASRQKLQQYCKTLLKFEPDYVFTHVTRLVPSKGLWRDLRVLEHLEVASARAQ